MRLSRSCAASPNSSPRLEVRLTLFEIGILAPLGNQSLDVVSVRLFPARMPRVGGGVGRVDCQITERGVRRYGFHGLSYEYDADVFPRFDAAAARGRVVDPHPANGATLSELSAAKILPTTIAFNSLHSSLIQTSALLSAPGLARLPSHNLPHCPPVMRTRSAHSVGFSSRV